MTTLAHEIALRLSNSGALTTAQPSGLGFVILERWPSPEGQGATPEVFDAARGNRLKRTIYVRGTDEVGNPARQAFDIRRWDAYPEIHVFAEAHANGKEATQSAYYVMESLLVGWEAIVAGQHIGFLADGWVAPVDSPDFAASVVAVCRFRATSTRKLVQVA